MSTVRRFYTTMPILIFILGCLQMCLRTANLAVLAHDLIFFSSAANSIFSPFRCCDPFKQKKKHQQQQQRQQQTQQKQTFHRHIPAPSRDTSIGKPRVLGNSVCACSNRRFRSVSPALWLSRIFPSNSAINLFFSLNTHREFINRYQPFETKHQEK